MNSRPDFLVIKPSYYLVKLDEVPPHLRRAFDVNKPPTLTFHIFGKLKRGDRVCVKAGEFTDVFGTVKRKSRRYSGYSFRCAKARKITVSELPREPISFSVEVG